MGKEERLRREKIDCPFCSSAKIPNPKSVFRHWIIMQNNKGFMDIHGPLDNYNAMTVAIEYMKKVRDKYCKSPLKKWWQFWR